MQERHQPLPHQVAMGVKRLYPHELLGMHLIPRSNVVVSSFLALREAMEADPDLNLEQALSIIKRVIVEEVYVQEAEILEAAQDSF